MHVARPIRHALAALFLLLVAPAAEAAEVTVLIDLSDQQMTVWRHHEVAGVWPVSTARAGKCTPTGVFRPQVLKEEHYSTRYDGAPMPWSIFFSGHYAIHGTTQVDRLGEPASAGCVRLHPENAKALFGWVQEAGKAETLIFIRE